MKKLLPTLALTTAAVLMLSSCSQVSNLTLTKRHYRSGYYVDFGGKKQNKIAAKTQTVAPLVAANSIPSAQISVPAVEQLPVAVSPVAVNVKSAKKASHTTKHLPTRNTHSIAAKNNTGNALVMAQTADNDLSVQASAAVKS